MNQNRCEICEFLDTTGSRCTCKINRLIIPDITNYPSWCPKLGQEKTYKKEYRIATDYEDWENWYSPIKNKIEPNAAFDGRMFETYGKEVAFVKEQPDNTIWTLIDVEDGYLVPGYRFVDRLGYFICEIAFHFPQEEYNKHELKL